MILLPYDSNFHTLYKKILLKLHLDRNVLLSYKDDGGELCGLQDDEDLQLAFMYAGIDVRLGERSGGDRLSIWCHDS